MLPGAWTASSSLPLFRPGAALNRDTHDLAISHHIEQYRVARLAREHFHLQLGRGPDRAPIETDDDVAGLQTRFRGRCVRHDSSNERATIRLRASGRWGDDFNSEQ